MPAMTPLKAKALGALSGASGSLGFLGSLHNACHIICEAAIAFLALFGIAVYGMPLMFLQDYAVYFWAMAVAFVAPTALLYAYNKTCTSREMLLGNAGVIVAGVPFADATLAPLLWFIGGTMLALAITLFVKKKFLDKSVCKK
jgi:hypothetical protein